MRHVNNYKVNSYNKQLKLFKEFVEYHTIDDSGYQITRVIRDDNHDYEYCEGILYELSKSGQDKVVYISEIENTEGNLFYNDQIDRYVEYLEDGGVLETFPVQESIIGGCRNLTEMLEYLDDQGRIYDQEFDELYKSLNKKFIDDILDIIFELSTHEVRYGIDGTILDDINNIKDLTEHYNKDSYLEEYYDEDSEEYELYGDPIYFCQEYYDGFKAILEYWDDNKEYTLTDMNHRFEAVKKLGKSKVIVDPS
jgi:predicted transcriptional regulator